MSVDPMNASLKLPEQIVGPAVLAGELMMGHRVNTGKKWVMHMSEIADYRAESMSTSGTCRVFNQNWCQAGHN